MATFVTSRTILRLNSVFFVVDGKSPSLEALIFFLFTCNGLHHLTHSYIHPVFKSADK
jgi:hypothetical protein